MDISKKILKFAENQKTIDEKLSNSDFSKSYENGYDIGYSEGETDGYSDGHTAGVADGKQTERDELLPTMWSAIVSEVPRSYQAVFQGLDFDNTTFKPEKIFRVTEGYSMFESCSVGLEEEKQIDLIEYESQRGIELFNLASCTKLNRAFYKCGLFKNLFAVDLSNNPITTMCFNYSTIQRIEYLIPPTENSLSNCFTGTTNLSYIGFCDTVYKNVNVQSCPLTNESAILLIEKLTDYSGTEKEYSYSISLSEDVWANLDALGNVSPNGNTWRDYCADIGWGT